MSEQQVHEEMLSEIDDRFDKSNGSFTYDTTRAVAIVVNKQEEKSVEILKKLDIENLTGIELERFVFQHTGISRKYGTHASEMVILTGTPFQTVNMSSLVAADAIFYETVHPVTLNEAGRAEVLVECQQTGPIGNVPAGAIRSFPVTLSGITSVTNERALTNGYPAETDRELRQRYYAKLQRPGKAGNEAHYEEWAKDVLGVGKVKVYPLWNGPLTIKVVIVDANTEIPSVELLSDVHDYITSQKPFGATLTVAPAEALEIDISVEITIRDGLVIGDVQSELEANIETYLKTLAFQMDYVSRAQIGRIILDTNGIVDYTDLLVNGVAENLTIPEAYIAVLGTVTLL